MSKYRLIDDPLCDINPNIDTYENCEDCPYFWDCMEEDDEEGRLKMINNFSTIFDDIFSNLLEIYQMKDWQMSWKDFLIQFNKELSEKIVEWKDSVEEEEE